MKKYACCHILMALLFLFPIYNAVVAQPAKYNRTKPIQYSICGFIKDSSADKPLSAVIVELFLKDDLTKLATVFTNYRGKFTFFLPKGNYMMIIRSRDYEEQLIPLQVTDMDINFKDILLQRIFEDTSSQRCRIVQYPFIYNHIRTGFSSVQWI